MNTFSNMMFRFSVNTASLYTAKQRLLKEDNKDAMIFFIKDNKDGKEKHI